MKTKINSETLTNLGFNFIVGSDFWQKGKIMISTTDYIFFQISVGAGVVLFKITTVKNLKIILNHIVSF